MANDIYMKIEGIEGESTAEGHKNEVELLSWSFGASNATSVTPGKTGLSAGRANVQDFAATKRTDKTTPPLFKACVTGKDIPKVTVSVRKATGDGGQADFLVYTFTNVMISSLQMGGSNSDDIPVESVTFAFAKVEVKYLTQATADNKVATPVNASFDVTAVKGA